MAQDDPNVDLDQLLGMARRFEEMDLVREALGMVEAAARVDPHNRAVQLHQARLRQKLRSAEESESHRELRERFRRNAIDACHFFGLAALYRDRGKHRLASECLEIALEKEPIHPYAYKLQGHILFEQKDYEGAREALRTARRFNPFDRWIPELLGRVEYEREHYREALEATVDAYLLLSDDDRDDRQQLEKRIRQYKRLVGTSPDDTKELFEERQLKLQTDYDRLEHQRERFLEERARRHAEAIEAADERGKIQLALALRRFAAFDRLSDDHVYLLTGAVERETVKAGRQIFDYGDHGGDIYMIEEGEIVIRRPTSYGTFELARLGPGVLFGEVNYLSRVERSGEALAAEETRVLRLDADGLDLLIDRRADLGVKLLLSFWQGLALKLRGANQELRRFFSTEQDEETLHKLRETAQGDTIDADAQETLALLREKGLSGRELETLAKFSNVKRFPGGTYLFHEDDPGGEMFVVLEGKVMISKQIGGGTEALAILQRGDFFGEMSLLDGAPRSADAKAYQGPVTVVVFDQQTLIEVEQVDPRASIEFIQLLCHLMCQRLRELDEKITSWRIMAGVRPDDSTDQVGFEFPAAGLDIDEASDGDVAVDEEAALVDSA